MPSQNFKVGKYYIGDLCYALEDDLYFPIVCEDKTHEFIKFGGTAYGDGTYSSNDFNFSFPVDSGTIGIAPYELCVKLHKEEKANSEWASKAGKIVDVKKSISFSDDGGGIFEIYIDDVPYKIDTRGEEDEDDYEDTCGECDGAGVIEQDCEACDGSGGTDEGDSCEDCGGTGLKDEECDRCRGTGII